MSSYNAIWIGYPFRQDFDTDAGAIPDGAALWLPLREAHGRRDLVIARVNLHRLSATSFRLALTAEQTALFRPGDVCGDLRLEVALVSTPLGVRITIPVEVAQ